MYCYSDFQTIVESEYLLDLEDEEHQLIFAKMIEHLRSLPLEGLGIVPNLDAKFLKDPQSLKYGFILPQYVAANGPPSNKIFENLQGSLFTFPYKDRKTCTVHLKRVLFRSHGIIGRGTIVIRVVRLCGLRKSLRLGWKEACSEAQFPCRNSGIRTDIHYMAHEQHFMKWKGPHRYRHDMESMFYVILFLTCLCSSPSEKLPTPPKTDYSYETWHKEGDDPLRGRKTIIITADNWQPSTMTFFDGFSWWLDKLQQSLRQGLSKGGMHRDAVKEAATVILYTQHPADSTSTCSVVAELFRPPVFQHDPALLNFDEDMLGGRFLYEEIIWVVHVFENKDLKTRSHEWQNTLLLCLQKEQQDEQQQKEQYKQQQEGPGEN
ncbi:hypothetical protein DFJ43DRAFT_1206124 [Lentinula guzmanii]|uniref:Uncharacterized protein n=1 Tax=Lentinula guzmanii TaxID=2804957 RepID=A0AA38MWR5_9AGAR|nr:hypothetical protein DFJ43DRAFT_1206124 [Lentinula guzmanii]